MITQGDERPPQDDIIYRTNAVHKYPRSDPNGVFGAESFFFLCIVNDKNAYFKAGLQKDPIFISRGVAVT